MPSNQGRENVIFKNFGHTTQGPFTLKGGHYWFLYAATTWGTLDLRVLADDGTTYVSVLSGATAVSANGAQSLYLAQGTYELVTDGSTLAAAYASVRSIEIPTW